MNFFLPVISISFLVFCCSCKDVIINEQELLEKTKEEIIKYCFEHSENEATHTINIAVISKNGGTEHLSFNSEKEAVASKQLKEVNVWDVLGVKIWGGYRYYRIEFLDGKVFHVQKTQITDF